MAESLAELQQLGGPLVVFPTELGMWCLRDSEIMTHKDQRVLGFMMECWFCGTKSVLLKGNFMCTYRCYEILLYHYREFRRNLSPP